MQRASQANGLASEELEEVCPAAQGSQYGILAGFVRSKTRKQVRKLRGRREMPVAHGWAAGAL